ncbi:TauD/TfdA family dioxygenase [Singulisphaera acidiphila]|uniref:Putative taurine catabolism dioxygenase n=1 Tax=Singulisphaera acidiphila (strain ATCC BAA-1392 / DSM 18658 / VKM B-2454 / MOB10) TaxID=886293 RepID=L0DDJ0_SINAD|nr:TauD/TfdA family dioxygenase [Singulisphaera acidiphila]AGA26741.1 putative taurine catabolism dioxygenase [Singulisphaera acidiphila DSM 18658]
MNESQIQISPLAVPGQQWHDGAPFPLAWECATPAVDFETIEAWIGLNRGEFCDQAHRHGAVLFRGFPLASAEDFDRFIAAFEFENFPYEDSLSNAVRVNRTPRVFTANEAPSTVEIFLHHEMAQTPRYPSRLFFFCEQPAEQGGATPICRSDLLWSRLVERCPDFAQACVEKGLTYSNVMPSSNDPNSGMGRSWQSTLRANTREEAEQRLKNLGYHWEWLDDGCLRATTPVLPAVHTLAPGRSSFFNQLIAAYCGWKDSRNDPAKSITFGDGAPLDGTAVQVAIALAEELTFDIPWQQGDVALVDNLVAMHGRRTFSGPRKILASLACPNT